MSIMQPKTEKLLRKVVRKCIGTSKVVSSFLEAIDHIRQLGDSSDIALTVMVLDLIEQNTSVMQDYLHDDSSIEIYEDMPVGTVLQAIISVLELHSLLMAGRVQKMAETKEYLDQVIAVLHAGTENMQG